MRRIISAAVEPVCTILTKSDGDLWPCAWAEDNALYTANGDGKGFDLTGEWCDIVVNRIDGEPPALIGVRLTGQEGAGEVFADPALYNRKPTGMVCVNGSLYMAVQNLNKQDDEGGFDDVPCCTICVSRDKGKTWHWAEQPMFEGYVFTTIMFLDYGKSNADSPDGYIYAYGLDNNWRASFCGCVPDPQSLYLARVGPDDIMDRAKWEFFCGLSEDGQPDFTPDIERRAPVLHDERRVAVTPPALKGSDPQLMSVISQGSVVYNKALNRYIYSSWTENTFEFYEAPLPYGPFSLFLSHDFGFYPWSEKKYGGYATVIPSKFISQDGKTMYVQSNTFMGGLQKYGFFLRRLTVELEPDTVK